MKPDSRWFFGQSATRTCPVNRSRIAATDRCSKAFAIKSRARQQYPPADRAGLGLSPHLTQSASGCAAGAHSSFYTFCHYRRARIVSSNFWPLLRIGWSVVRCRQPSVFQALQIGRQRCVFMNSSCFTPGASKSIFFDLFYSVDDVNHAHQFRST